MRYRAYLLKCLEVVPPVALAGLFTHNGRPDGRPVHNSHIYKARRPGGRVSPTLRKHMRATLIEIGVLPPPLPRRLKVRRDDPESAAASLINNLEEEHLRVIHRLLGERLGVIAVQWEIKRGWPDLMGEQYSIGALDPRNLR